VGADGCLGGPSCSPGVCAVVWYSAGNGEDSASGSTTLPARAWTKPATHGLSPASRSHCRLSPQGTRIEGGGGTEGGLDNPKLASS